MDDITKFMPNLARYETLMDVVRNRLTTRAFGTSAWVRETCHKVTYRYEAKVG